MRKKTAKKNQEKIIGRARKILEGIRYSLDTEDILTILFAFIYFTLFVLYILTNSLVLRFVMVAFVLFIVFFVMVKVRAMKNEVRGLIKKMNELINDLENGKRKK